MSELDDIKAQRAMIAATRAAAAAERDAAAELLQARQGLLDDQALIDAEAKHGAEGVELQVVHTPLGAIVIKRPHQAIFNRYQDKGATDTEALEKLVRPCLVHPAADAFDKILAALPATLMRCANAVATLAGVKMEEDAKK